MRNTRVIFLTKIPIVCWDGQMDYFYFPHPVDGLDMCWYMTDFCKRFLKEECWGKVRGIRRIQILYHVHVTWFESQLCYTQTAAERARDVAHISNKTRVYIGRHNKETVVNGLHFLLMKWSGCYNSISQNKVKEMRERTVHLHLHT